MHSPREVDFSFKYSAILHMHPSVYKQYKHADRIRRVLTDQHSVVSTVSKYDNNSQSKGKKHI